MGTGYYLAIDIGASSGRHILGSLVDGKIVCEEIYRFSNGPVNRDGHLYWDIDHLEESVIAGIAKCKEIGKIPVSIAIDTWAVDYVPLDAEGKRLRAPFCYRDGRTAGVDDAVYAIIPEKDLYRRTGIQKQIFNTIYQLMADKLQDPDTFAKTESILMIPDYLNYVLTGKKCFEYTNASTTQLLDPAKRDWDLDLIRMLGLPEKLFPALSEPGTLVGNLSAEMQEKVGFDAKVVLPGTHDTASAVLAVPMTEDAPYISSGTWSLLGAEKTAPDTGDEAQRQNFTNEGGAFGTIRFLKNIMGLWMIQQVRHELNDGYSFAELCDLAEKETIETLVDCNDARFLAPASMIEEIRTAAREQGAEIPQTPGQLAKVIYRSLAVCYKDAIAGLEKLQGRTYQKLHIVGGGANADYLNRLTAKSTGKTIYAGPTEATAIGNLTIQMIADGVFADIKAARKCIGESFEIKVYEDKPVVTESMDDYEEELERSFHRLSVGDLVRGVVIGVSDKDVTVDLGTYSEGIVPITELSNNPAFSIKGDIHVGDPVAAVVTREDNGRGAVALSIKKADDILAWDSLKQAKEDEEPFQVKIAEAVKGGVVTYLKGIRAFIPASQIAASYVEEPQEYVGKIIPVKVLEIDQEDKRLVLSGKAVAREKEAEARRERLSHIEIGAITEGTVERIERYGAFVKIGEDLSGLVHISQIANHRIKSVREVLTEGDTVKVKVLAVEDGKIRLSIKAVLDDEETAVQESVEDAPTEYHDGEAPTTSLADLLKGLKFD